MIKPRGARGAVGAILLAAFALSGGAEARGAKGSALPPAAEVARVIRDGTYHEAATLGIDIIELYRKGGTPESVELTRELVGICNDAAVPEKRRKVAMELIASAGGAEAALFLARELRAKVEKIVLPAARAAGKLLRRHRGATRPRSLTRATEKLTDRLVDLVEDGEGPVRAAAMEALAKAGAVDAAPALIELLRNEKGEDRALANKALQEISGRKMPAAPGAWESWHYCATTPPEERETDEEHAERLMADAPVAAARRTVTRRPAGTPLAIFVGLGAVGATGMLLALRALATKRATARLEANRRRLARFR